MPLVVKDRVQETSTTVGTGTLTLLGAVTGFQTFSGAIGNTNTTYYTIQGGAEFEVGVGTVSAGALSRDTVLESSNGGSLVNFSVGSKFVFCTYPAEKSVDIETAQTLTNKTISGASNTISNINLASQVTGTLPVANGGTGVTTSTGSGNNVLSTSPTLVTPALGTPSSGNLANCTFPTLNQNTTGTAATATNLSTNQGNWSSNGTISAVVGLLAWKNYGNGHVIFDASNGTSPSGTAVNNANAQGGWTGTYPTLMGWNGGNTFGVRVDSARVSDSTTTATNLSTASGAAPSYSARAWVNFNGTGTVAIRASGNVSSITDLGVGRYRINFASSMPDANYAMVSSGANSGTGTTEGLSINVSSYLTTSVSVYVKTVGIGDTDSSNMNIAILR